LADARKILPSVENPLQRLLLALKTDDLHYAYPDDKAPLVSNIETFGPLVIAARAQDGDPWHSDEPAGLKYVLDTLFPVDGLDVKSIVGGGLIVGKPADDVAVSLANIGHVSRFVESAPVPVCCAQGNSRPSS